jgi:hypothetical protein
MSTPDSTTRASKLETASRTKQDDLTRAVGTPLATPTASGKAPWWKRLLGRS